MTQIMPIFEADCEGGCCGKCSALETDYSTEASCLLFATTLHLSSGWSAVERCSICLEAERRAALLRQLLDAKMSDFP